MRLTTHQVKTNSKEKPEGETNVDWDEEGEEQEEGAQTLRKNKIILLMIDAWPENVFDTYEIMKLFMDGMSARSQTYSWS